MIARPSVLYRLSVSVCLPVCMYLCVSPTFCPTVCRSVLLCACALACFVVLSVYVSVRMYANLSVCLSLCLSVYLCVCISLPVPFSDCQSETDCLLWQIYNYNRRRVWFIIRSIYCKDATWKTLGGLIFRGWGIHRIRLVGLLSFCKFLRFLNSSVFMLMATE